MDNILLVSNNKYGYEIFNKLKLSSNKYQFIYISTKEKFNEKNIKKINPKYIFVPFWSSLISKNIYSNFECINFHMTDLPYGRGGTPLQNLIIRNIKKTKITAFRCNSITDGGDIYLKRSLNLNGSADEIFKRSSIKIYKMICNIIKEQIIPKPQIGKAYKFKRRLPSQSNIEGNKNLKKVYDFIRMLDADGYPKSYLETKDLKFEFTKAKMYKKYLTASVKIYKKN